MERLRISPESVVVRMDPTLHRTEQRGISLLLKAIPSSVKETVIAEKGAVYDWHLVHPSEELSTWRIIRTDPSSQGAV